MSSVPCEERPIVLTWIAADRGRFRRRSMKHQAARAKIAEVGIIPAVRVRTPEDAWFAAEAVSKGGIPIVELTMTVPKATELIAHLAKKHPDMVVGAGTVLDVETARR